MKILVAALGGAIIVVLAGLLFLLSGLYNVGATDPHTAVEEWLLHTTMHRSVERRAAEVSAPPAFGEVQLRDGFKTFDAMCVGCHGAPGKDRSIIAEGLLPQPPDLAKSARHLNTKEIFWIVKNGIKMSGMPAFGPTHADQEIWNVVGFVSQKLPKLKPNQYRTLSERYTESLQ